MHEARQPTAAKRQAGTHRWPSLPVGCLAVWLGLAAVPLPAVDSLEQPPILYSATQPTDAVARLHDRVTKGDVRLTHDVSTGYLRSVLDHLRIPVSSQALVFSKTSLQQRRITPGNPRAIYFNDEVYVGFVRGGDVLEFSVADPQLGTVFYTLDQRAADRPMFVRQTDRCLICHGGTRTRGVPGHIVRSVYADRVGQPIFSAGSRGVDDGTPFAERWGGWYVSGRHGAATHLGNITYSRRPEPADAADTTGLNQVDLRSRFDATGYLSAHSDLVALTVLVHQASAHTILAKASFDARMALHREAALNQELGEPVGHRWPSTNTILDAAATALVECFLFAGASPLPAPIEGSTSFADDFASRGPADAQGRSLRLLDLRERVFRYPCSFLIDSQAFDALPEELRRRFWARMDSVLCGAEAGGTFAHLTPADRTAIREILAAIKPDAPRHWIDR